MLKICMYEIWKYEKQILKSLEENTTARYLYALELGNNLLIKTHKKKKLKLKTNQGHLDGAVG